MLNERRTEKIRMSNGRNKNNSGHSCLIDARGDVVCARVLDHLGEILVEVLEKSSTDLTVNSYGCSTTRGPNPSYRTPR